jgi:hypothetical protein
MWGLMGMQSLFWPIQRGNPDLKQFGIAGVVRVDAGNGRTVTQPVLTDEAVDQLRREYLAESPKVTTTP